MSKMFKKINRITYKQTTNLSKEILSKKILVVFILSTVFILMDATVSLSQVSGNVFRDYDSNGLKQNAEPGVADVVVTAYPATGAVVSTTTNSTGAYSFTATQLPSATTVRLEFSNLPTSNFSGPFAAATGGSGTSVQFVTAGAAATGINFGVNLPSEYCEANPLMATSVYVNGNTNSTAPVEAIVSFNYSAPTTPNKLTAASKSNLGSVWGLAYSRTRKKLYSGAFLKRHVGIGPSGLGAIYTTNVDGTTNASLLVTVPNVGTIPDNTTRGLTTPTAPSLDAAAFPKVGSVGLGDVEISSDEQFLYTVNLNNNKIYIINISTATIVDSVAAPNPGCSATGQYHAFGLSYKDRKLYVGITCDASISNNRTDLKSFVYVMDATTKVFNPTPVLTIPLDYVKGAAWNVIPGGNGAGGETRAAGSSKWHPWANTWSQVAFNAYTAGSTDYVSHPQPLLSDIEFDETGAMILGFIDRTGHQLGDFNSPPSGSGNLILSIVGGDILRAGQCAPNTWTLENNGSVCGSTASASQKNNQGPGGGEFYYQEAYSIDHLETVVGGLALKLGTGEVKASTMDPAAYYSGGVIGLSNTTGAQSTAYNVYQGGISAGFFSKSAGIGDLELMCGLAPIEIGNRVWADTDSDGIQDPNEAGMNGIEVRLYNTAGTLVGITTTNTSGEYYFNQTNIDNTGVSIAGVPNTSFSGLAEATQYYIVIGKNATFNTTLNELVVGGVRYFVTSANTGEGTTPDVNDNDATLASGVQATIDGFPYISVLTGTAGTVNHTYDFGFKLVCNVGFTLASSNVTCYGAENAQITVTTTSGTAPFMFSKDAGGTYQTSNIFTGLAPGTYSIWVKDANNCVKTCN
jgi:SdrD B-like domain